MKILLIKTSSMGDAIHALPALTDAMRHFPNLTVDWVIEEAFTDIPKWHPAVNKVIPVALRRWRKSIFKSLKSGEIRQFIKNLRSESYDKVIDAQGLFKSAVISNLSKGEKHGYDKASSKEPIGWALNKTHFAPKDIHAVTRIRQLFAKSLNYPMPETEPDYGISEHFGPRQIQDKTILFAHGTTWPTKHWPEAYWVELAKMMTDVGYKIMLPSGNAAERARAERIASASPNITVLAKTSLTDLGFLLKQMQAVVAVDTGISHYAAALNIPTITLYGPTSPKRIGTYGKNQLHLTSHFSCAPCHQTNCTYPKQEDFLFPPCFAEITPLRVWSRLQNILKLAQDSYWDKP